jgi:drug/metabolite transporter (DMT)-like permease
LFLTSIYYLKRRQLPFSSKSLKQGVAGIFEPALAYMIGIFGLKMTTASNASLIGASEVILTIVLAAVFLRERLTRIKLLLTSTSFSGILLLMLGEESAGHSDPRLSHQHNDRIFQSLDQFVPLLTTDSSFTQDPC